MGTHYEVSFRASFKNGTDTTRENSFEETLSFDKSATLEEVVTRIEQHGKTVCLREKWKFQKIQILEIHTNGAGDHS